MKDKIDPQHLKEEAKEVLRDTTVGNAQRLVHTVEEKSSPLVAAIKRNPVPAAVGVGVSGLALLLWKRRRNAKKGEVVPEVIRPALGD